MERRVLWMALLLGAALSVGCGGDDGGNDDDDDNQGESGSGGDDGESGAGGGAVGGEGVACGTTRCEMPEGATAEACCFDAFSSTCGMRGGFGGGNACVAIVETDPRCPNVMAGPVMLASCCVDNMCGITAPLFGMNECTELSVAEQMAMDRADMFNNDDDGGISFDGGGFMLDFPDPQACE